MTTDIEQEFFKVFGIEKRKHAFLFSEPDGSKYYYPKITDRKLLEMICIYNIYLGTKLYSLEVQDLKDEILQDLIDEQEFREIKKYYVGDDLKQQIQQLFKGEE